MLSGSAKNRKFSDIVDVFEAVSEKNVVSYNAMLSGYLGIGHFMSARKMFDEMGERNVVSWDAMINEYVKDEWMLRLIRGRPWPSGFGSGTTAEQVTGSNLTAIVIGFPTERKLEQDNSGVPKKGSDIDPQEAQQTLEIVEANVKKAEGRRQKIEANLALRRARTRVEAINPIS
ncbi:ATP synthase epsilon chain, chloroplastic [Capsicum chinense]|nr:ATP synthase epsilon chain, chloroplastic [Capsicum chinense]